MITEVPTKLPLVRWVRCPKCLKVLPELATVPVYQCGGCGTILQAKRRKNNVDDEELLNHGTDRSQTTDLERSSSEDREPHRPVQEEPSSAGELLLNQNNGSDQSEIIKEKNTNQPEETKEEGTQYGGARLSDGAASSIELDHQHESVESSPEAETHSAMNQTAMVSSPRDNQISNEVVSSTEVDHQVSEGTLRQMDGSSYYSGRRDEEDIDDYQKQPEDANFSGEVALSTELNHQLSERSSIDAKSFDEEDENQDYVDESKEDDENLTLEEKVDGVTNALEQCSVKVASSPEISHRRSELSSVESKSDETKNHLGRNNGIDSGGWKRRESSGELSSSTEDLLSGSPGNSMARRFSGESFLTDGFMSPRDEDMALDSYEGVGDKPKSRTTTINYAYEGSVSSYDEEDEPISLRKDHLSRKKKAAEAEAGAGSTRTVGIDNKVRSGFPDRTVSPEYNRFATGNLLPVRTRMKFKPDEGTSKPPSCSKSHRAGYENRNRLNYASNEFNRPSSKSPEVLEEEKIELLKMVYDLQKELKRTQISSGKARFPSDHESSEVGLFCDLNHTRSAFSCNQGRRPYLDRDPRVPFSAEAALRRRQDDSYCVHCCPQDWQLQALLPPHSCCNRTTQSVFNSGRRSYNLHHSGGSTPRNYPISELSDEHWVRDHDTSRIHREKTQSAKSHVRPVVGGAPLVACYKCSELLQIPADFLLFKRKVHQLKCGVCSATLKFSLHKGTNIVPYEVYAADAAATDIVAPPPSEVDSFSKFASPSRATERDPYSGDYGPPVSYSTETEPSSVGARSNGRKNRLGASEGRKEESLLKGLGKKIYNSAGGSSSKISKTKRMSSEIQEVSGSPLHKLMGYSSPSKVIER